MIAPGGMGASIEDSSNMRFLDGRGRAARFPPTGLVQARADDHCWWE